MLKQHKHHWLRVSNKPWFSSFGAEVVLECSICHRFINVRADDVRVFAVCRAGGCEGVRWS